MDTLRKQNNIKGFTLVELLVVIVIMGIAITAIFSFFLSSNNFFIMGNNQRDSQNDARLAADVIMSEVRYATNAKIVSSSEAAIATGNAIYLENNKLNIVKEGTLKQTISGHFNSLNFNKNSNDSNDTLTINIVSSYGNRSYPVTVVLKLPNLILLSTSISGVTSGVAIKYSTL